MCFPWKCRCLGFRSNDKTKTDARPKGITRIFHLRKKAKNSRFLELPTELHHLILELAPIGTAFNLKLTCKYMYQCGPLMETLLDKIKTNALARYELEWIRERTDYPDPSETACAGCLCFHVRAAFTEDQLRNEDSHRQCRGSQRRIRLTPDFTISFLDFFGQRLNGSSMITAFETEYRRNHSRGEFHEYPWIEDTNYMIRNGETSSRISPLLVYDWSFDIDRFPEASTSLETLIYHLALNPVSFCPHLYSYHRDIASTIRKMQEDALRFDEENPWIKRSCLFCSTELVTSWDLDRRMGLGVVHIRVKRCVTSGDHFSALDLQWFNQSEAQD